MSSEGLGLLRHTLAEVGCEALFCGRKKAGGVKVKEMSVMDDDVDMECFFRTCIPHGSALGLVRWLQIALAFALLST